MNETELENTAPFSSMDRTNMPDILSTLKYGMNYSIMANRNISIDMINKHLKEISDPKYIERMIRDKNNSDVYDICKIVLENWDNLE